MVKLRLSVVPDDRPVKLTLELTAAVHRDLTAAPRRLAVRRHNNLNPRNL
jgi:hypothetical protein